VAEIKANEVGEEAGGEKSFFARGALLGLFGGAALAILLISVAGTVVSLFDDVFGSPTVAAADEEPTEVDPLVAAGEDAALANGCTVCHSTDGTTLVGPSWKGLSEADEAYLRTSILDPDAELADGFAAGIMDQDYADRLTDADVDALVAYLSSL